MAREMKDSGIEWIGEIPKEWLVKKIKHGFTIFAGATPKSEKSEYWNGMITKQKINMFIRAERIFLWRDINLVEQRLFPRVVLYFRKEHQLVQ